MSHNDLKILLVDDDPVLIEMHSALLEHNDYSVLVAEDGEQALDVINNFYDSIGVVVSDITMPKMDGYELCSRIKQNEYTADLPVIFVSALTSLEEKLKGYAVGADDYIPKPVNDQELCKKIHALLNIRDSQKNLSKQVAETHSMAMQAMTFSSELGQVIEFYNKVLNCDSYAEIASCYFEVVSSFNLVSILQIYTPQKVLNFSESGIVSPLEANVIELARDKGRFFDFGARTIVNYNAFSILVKNMPLGDKEKYGRTKDILGMLANGLEAKIQQLNNVQLAERKEEMILSIKDSISSINNSFRELQVENISAIEEMNDRVNEEMMTLGLTEVQENNIQNITESCLERSNKAFYKGVSIEENLNNIYQQFQYIIGAKVQN